MTTRKTTVTIEDKPVLSVGEFQELNSVLRNWKSTTDAIAKLGVEEKEHRQAVYDFALRYVSDDRKTPFPGITFSTKVSGYTYDVPATEAYLLQRDMMLAAATHGAIGVSQTGVTALVMLMLTDQALFDKLTAAGVLTLDKAGYEATLKGESKFAGAPAVERTYSDPILSMNAKSVKTDDALYAEVKVVKPLDAEDAPAPVTAALDMDDANVRKVLDTPDSKTKAARKPKSK